MPKTKIINVKNYLVDCTHKLKAASKFYIERNKLEKVEEKNASLNKLVAKLREDYACGYREGMAFVMINFKAQDVLSRMVSMFKNYI